MNTKKVLFVLGVVLFAVLVIVALLSFNKKEENNSSKIKVVTSFYPLYFFTSQIVGDKAVVSNITPSGAEPHEYEPTARDMATIEGSDLLILNGGGLESWGKNIRSNINADKTKIVMAGEDLTTMALIKEEQKVVDPHIWLSPILAQQMIDSIESGLSQVDPNNTLYYESNAKNLKEKLSVLDEEFKQGLSTCGDKNIVTSHSAFAYLAREYNLNQVSIAGLSPEEEPSSKQMADIAKFAKDNNVKYIFFESLISPKLSETIAKEIGAQTLVLNPIEGLTEEEINSGKDYFTEMRNNLANLKIALQCTQ
jgi:zinc transport system substrate-binding protein